MITSETTIVYRAPTRGRRFLTLNGALYAEAKSLIYKKYPNVNEYFESDTGHSERGYNIEYDEPDRYERMHSRLMFILKNEFIKSLKEQ